MIITKNQLRVLLAITDETMQIEHVSGAPAMLRLTNDEHVQYMTPSGALLETLVGWS